MQFAGISASRPNAAVSAGLTGRDPKAIQKAAQDFEAILIAGILKMVRESASLDKSATGESDQAGATALEIAEEQLSRTLAQNGGIGLASLLAKGLAAPAPTASAVPETVVAPAPATSPAIP